MKMVPCSVNENDDADAKKLYGKKISRYLQG